MVNVQSVEYTTSGYIEVYGPDGAYISRHRLIDEARESALTHALEAGYASGGYEYTFVSPNSRMSIEIGEAPVVVDPVDPPVDPDPIDPDPVDPDPVDPVEPGDEPYDLSGFDIPFDYEWPLPPETNQAIAVPAGDMAALRAAVATDGSVVTVPAGVYSGSLVFGNNVLVNAADGAVWRLTGSVDINTGSRVRWNGGVIDGQNFAHSLRFANRSDFLFDNVDFRDLYSMYPFFGTSGERIAFINSTGRFFHYFYFTQGGFTGTRTKYSNAIIANCDIEAGYPGGAEATVRWQRLDGGIVVNSRLWNGAKHSLRTHYGSRNIFAAGNRFEEGSLVAMYTNGSGAATARPEDHLGAHYLLDNIFLAPDGIPQNVQRGPSSTRDFDGPVVIQGNRSYHNAQSNANGEENRRFAGAVQAGDVTAGNVEYPYSRWDGRAFNGGADH